MAKAQPNIFAPGQQLGLDLSGWSIAIPVPNCNRSPCHLGAETLIAKVVDQKRMKLRKLAELMERVCEGHGAFNAVPDMKIKAFYLTTQLSDCASVIIARSTDQVISDDIPNGNYLAKHDWLFRK